MAQFATFCHQMPLACHLPGKRHITPQSAAFCTFLLPVPKSLRHSPSDGIAERRRADQMTVRTGATGSDKRSGKWVTQVRNRLAARREEKPLTKAGQIRALWREIEGALADGQSLKSIREWLEEEGVTVTRATLSSYKRRFRRREEANRNTEALEAFLRQTGAALQTPDPPDQAQEASAETPRVPGQPIRDPFAQARRALEKTFDIRTIHGDGDPTGRNLV